jgi:hypothetical protein
MYEVSLPLKEQFTYWDVVRSLPTGWVAEPSDDGVFIYDIQKLGSRRRVGKVEITDNELVFSVDESTEDGAKFWDDFSYKYPMNSPQRVCYGIVYKISEKIYLFEKTVTQNYLPGVLENMRKYKAIDVYFVTFFLGDLKKGKELKGLYHQRIDSEGSLGDTWGECVFSFSNPG